MGERVVSVKTAKGDIRTITKVPKGANVTLHGVNKYEEERLRNMENKENTQLNKFCDGNDTTWRPEHFFTETCGDDDVPPWPIRPTELFTNPHLMMKIMGQQMEKKKAQKEKKKLEKMNNKDGEKKKKDKKG